VETELQVCALRNHKVLFYRRRAAYMSKHIEHRYYLSLLHSRPRFCTRTLHSAHSFH